MKFENADPYRWRICALLFCATTINYMDRQALALLKPVLDQQLGWTNEQFGYVNSAFQGAYGLGLLGFGWFIDRCGTRIGYAVSVTFWSLAALGHSLVGSVAGFVSARITLGLGESGNWPAAVKAVAEWFPQPERAYATGLFNSGTLVGAIVGPAIIPYLAAAWGWQAAFIFAGLSGFVWLVFWLLLHRAPQVPALAEPTGAEERHQVSWVGLLRYRQTWSFAVGKFLMDPVFWFYLIWLPDYFHKTRNLDLKHLGLPILLIYVIATGLSVGGSRLSDLLVQRGWTVTRSRKWCMFGFMLCLIPILLEVRYCGLWGAVVLIGTACGVHQAWAANLFTTVSDLFPKRLVASVTGLGGMAGCLSGLLFPIFTGKLLDRFAQTGQVETGYALLFGLCAGAYLAAFVGNHLLAPRFEPVSA